MKKLLYIILIVLSTACVSEDIIEIDYKNCDSILNVYAVLSPQSDSTFIFITNTSSLNKIINLKTLQDGVVTISENKKSCILKRIKEKPSVYACSSNDLLIKKGSTYKLSIEIPGYHSISAETKIPNNFSNWISPKEPIPGISILKDGYYKTYTFNSGWNKSDCGFNYFSKRIYGVRFNHNKEEFDSLGNFVAYPENTDTIPFPVGSHNHLQGANKMVNCADLSSVKIVTSAGFSNKNNDLWIIPALLYHGITYYIYTVDKNYSNYIELFDQYKDPPWSDANPIEPRIDYILPSTSNIEGGYGLFGSYGYDSVYFDLTNLQDFYSKGVQ